MDISPARHASKWLALAALAVAAVTQNAAAEPFGMLSDSRITAPCSPFASGSGGFTCGPGTNNPDIDEAFGSGIDTVSTSVQNPAEVGTFGSASGSIDPATGLPELFAYAQSTANDATSVNVEAVNLFTYTGPDNFMLDVIGLYSGTTTGIGATMFGGIAIIPLGSISPTAMMDLLDQGSSPSFSFGEGINVFDEDSFSTTNGGAEMFTLTASMMVNSGDQFYIWSQFGGRAVGDGAIFDGLSTASLLLNTTNVVASSVVPLPAGVWLLLSGLGTVGWLRRRRRPA